MHVYPRKTQIQALNRCHTECPVHNTRLCHAWFAIPKSWQTCAFPKRLNLHFDKEPNELCRLSLEATPYHLVGESGKPFVPVIGRSTDDYRQILNEAAKLNDPAEWDTRVISLLSEAQVADVEHDLLDNTAYLVVRVSDYLLDMVEDLPVNPFQMYMDDQRRIRIPTETEVGMIRQIAASLVEQINPWFGLTLLRSLKYILSLDLNERNSPTWIDQEILHYALEAKRFG